MKALRISLLLACCVQLLFAGCTDNENIAPDIDAFFNNNKPQSQFFTFDAGESKMITGARGTRLFFPKGSFLTQGGEVISSGEVEVELKEVLTPKDMILSNISTVSEGELLMSAGQVSISAKQSNQTLRVNNNVRPRLLMPTTNFSEPMQIFYGGIQTLNGNSTLTWTLADSAVVYPSFDPTPGIVDSTRRYYNFNFDSLTWINYDYFYRDGNGVTPVSVVVPETFDNVNCAAYLVFPDLNSVIGIAGYHAGTNTFTTDFAVPLVNATIVVIAGKDDQYYFYTNNVTITNNHTETATLSPATEAAINNVLNEL